MQNNTIIHLFNFLFSLLFTLKNSKNLFVKILNFKFMRLNIIFLILVFMYSNSFAKKNPANKVEIPNLSIGNLEYLKLKVSKGIYKKETGPDNCIEGEYRLMKDPKSGRVFLMADGQIFINHLDQKVVNAGDNECFFSYFNTINELNELESTEIQSCSQPINISSIRTLKIKFEPEKIQYVFIFKDPVNNTTKKTTCELLKAI